MTQRMTTTGVPVSRASGGKGPRGRAARVAKRARSRAFANARLDLAAERRPHRRRGKAQSDIARMIDEGRMIE